MDEAEPDQSPPTLETAIGWLEQSKPAAVLKIFRDPDFTPIGETAFAGFRVNAAGYARPLVRQRLALEAVRNKKFAEKLQACAEESAPAAPHPPKTNSPPAPAKSVAPTNAEHTRLEVLRTERDRIRRERDELKLALADADSARRESEKQRRQAEAERNSANEQAQRQAQRIARLERQITKLKIEQEGLRRAARREVAPDDRKIGNPRNAPSPIAMPPISQHAQDKTWPDAVARLLDKSHYETAARVAENVLRSEPGNIDAIEIAARAYEGMEALQHAAPLFRRLLAARLAKGERVEAGEILLRLLMLAPDEIEKNLSAYLGGLRVKNTHSIEQAHALFARLRSLAPETHSAVSAIIPKLVSKQLTAALAAPAGPPGADAPLPLGSGGSTSARFVISAVAQGDVEQVIAIRDILERLRKTDATVYEQIRKALEQAAGGDQSLLIPVLSRQIRGPIIVDGSNAAWHDQESLAQGHPRLQPLLNLRRVLRAQRYFPILLLADANLPYVIDDPATLNEMLGRREITLVDSGVDADEIIIRRAKQYDAPVVTNDYMDDWDPLHEVRKIRYAISPHGEPVLLPED